MFQKVFKNFKYNGKERLSKFSLLTLLILDFFVLIAIFDGLEFQREVIMNPETEWSYGCRQFTGEVDLDSTIYNYTYYDYGYNSYYGDTTENNELSPECQNIIELAKSVGNSQKLKDIKHKVTQTDQHIYAVSSEISSTKQKYDSALLEKIANQEANLSILGGISADNIKESLEKLEIKLQNFKTKKAVFEKEFFNSDEVIKLKNYISEKGQFIEDNYLNDTENYKWKIYLSELVFTLPLVLIFYFIMIRHRRGEHFIQYVVSKHLFIVSLFPFLLTIFEIVLNFIPNEFINLLIDFFYELDIPFLLYYFLIGIVVFFTLLFLMYLQRRRTNREKNDFTRIESFKKGRCVSCSNKISYDKNFCPYCGENLKENCENCGKDKVRGFLHCEHCGAQKP
jgi:preprotein translocase subunit YajC